MSEYDLFFAWSEVTSHVMTLLQLWVSITFALLMVGHFVPHKLNVFLVSLLVLMYSAFSTYFFALFISDGRLIMSIYNEAASLVEAQGENASEPIVALSTYLSWGGEIGAAGVVIVLPIMFISTIAYLIYNYRTSQNSADDS